MTRPRPLVSRSAFTHRPPLRIPQRTHADLIVQRAALLDEKDHALLAAVYADNQHIADLARIQGIHPRNLCARVHRLVARVLATPFAFVVRASADWPPTRRKVAFACFVLGRSIRAAARESGISFYAARRHYDAVLGMVEAGAPC